MSITCCQPHPNINDGAPASPRDTRIPFLHINLQPPTTQQSRSKRSFGLRILPINLDVCFALSFINLVASLNFLIPFTIDHLGGLGYFAHRLLLGTTDSPPPPPWHQPTDLPTTSAYNLFSSTLQHSPLNLLQAANSNCDPRSHFGSSHHSHTPKLWALQILGLNFTSATSHHLLKSIASSRPRHSARSPKHPTTTRQLGFSKTVYFPHRRVLQVATPLN
jgi:hypothetical protein